MPQPRPRASVPDHPRPRRRASVPLERRTRAGGRGRTDPTGLQPLGPGGRRGSRLGVREDRLLQWRVPELPPLPPGRRRTGNAHSRRRARAGARMPARLLARVREGLVRQLKGTPMKASLPRRMTLHAIEAAVLTLAYRVTREPFDVVAFRALYDGKRFHMRLGSRWRRRDPQGSVANLQVVFTHDATGRPRTQGETEEIACGVNQ